MIWTGMWSRGSNWLWCWCVWFFRSMFACHRSRFGHLFWRLRVESRVSIRWSNYANIGTFPLRLVSSSTQIVPSIPSCIISCRANFATRSRTCSYFGCVVRVVRKARMTVAVILRKLATIIRIGIRWAKRARWDRGRPIWIRNKCVYF